MQPVGHIFVATPAYGGLATTGYINSVLALQIACVQQGIGLDVQFFVDSLVTRARNELITLFTKNKRATHLIFIDADIGFSPEQVFRLLCFYADIVAGAYPLKLIDWAKAERAMKSGRPDVAIASLHYVLAWENSSAIEARDGFARVKRAGTGFLMIRRRAVERMCEAYPELRHRAARIPGRVVDKDPRWALFDCMIDPETEEYLSEDYSFCWRWRKIGGEIWMDTRSKLSHIGSITFAGDLQAQFR